MKQKANRTKPWIVVLIILTGAALISSCEKYTYKNEVGDPVIPVLFQTEVQPIFTANCIMCHKGSRDPDLRDGNSYASLTDGKFLEMPAESSKLYLMIISGSHSSYTLPEEKFKILYWIQQGAKDN